MKQFTMNLPTLKEIEVKVFQQLQVMFADLMVRCLEQIDQWIMEHRDHARYRLRDIRQVAMSTVFGEITFKRRLYQDREKGTHVYLLDQALSFDGQSGISPHLEEWAVELATAGPSYHEAARQMEKLLGYRAISHETIRQRLISKAEQKAAVPKEKKPAKVLFVEVDGLYTKLQRTKRRHQENKIAIIHEGWERHGKRTQLRNKVHYLHKDRSVPFWEGFGDFLIEHYDVNEETWLVVTGDGADWIGECESYFHKCIYTLDRFHVARELKRYLRELPAHWQAARQALAAYDPQALMAAVEAVPVDQLSSDLHEGWERFKAFLRQHENHLIDYRKVLKANGLEVKGMRPMGSAESQMRTFAKRTKRGGYSWSVRGVQAILQSIILRKEGRAGCKGLELTDVREEKSPIRISQLMKKPKEFTTGVINGMLRTLQTSKQSSPLGMALKGLRG